MLGYAALKAERIARGVKLDRGWMTDQAAEVNKMFLGGRTLLQFDLPPLSYKIACRHCFANPFHHARPCTVEVPPVTSDKR
jgi:hypothetical protein